MKPVVFSGAGTSRNELIERIKGLPKPAAILAAFDDRAVDVLEACRVAGLAVPSDVAVLGIGNDEPICETSIPPLSSVAVDFESQGYRAARELQALMLGGTNPKTDIRFREVRNQSILSAILERCLNEVKRLLAETDLSLEEIAERCGYRSPDVLRVLFKRQTGVSPRFWRKIHRSDVSE